MKTLCNFDEIKYKNDLVDKAIIQLKKDFVGIDEQIEQVMNNVRTWYLYPELQSRPVIVSLWGMSGIGKTSLVRKIAEYLNIEKDLVYFNFAEIGEMHSYDIEQSIEEELSNERSNRMFVYDEFQYAATLDGNGEEKDNKSGLKPFWELMDSGILHKRHVLWEVNSMFTLLSYLIKINMAHPIELKDGIWINADECLKHFKEYDILKFRNYFNFTFEGKKATKPQKLVKAIAMAKSSPHTEEDEFRYDYFIQSERLEKIIEIAIKTDSNISDKLEKYHELCKKNVDEMIEFLTELCENINKGYDLKFNDSIIFVIGNLDEAYQVSFNVNPDMSPDQFHKITKKISIVDIKEALKRRFRNEQIARLGNIHVIYPAFSSKTFRELIDMDLNKYAKVVKESIGYEIRYDKTIKKCIYDEAVFPTHGTRPIFSTVHEIIKSKLPEIVRQIQINNLIDKVNFIEFSFKQKKTIINVYDKLNNKIKSIIFKDKLRLNTLRESLKDEEQALCAVHESGHFVIYAALKNKMPEKIVSRTTDSDTGGFLMEDIDNSKNMQTFRDVLSEIQICLGGYIAEKTVFGEEYLTNGACSDLEKATIIASKAIREWGFSEHPYIKTYLTSMPPEKMHLMGHAIHDVDDEIQKSVCALFDKAYSQVEELFRQKEWRQMLKESSQYLSINSSMTQKKMMEIYSKIPENIRFCENETFYRDKIDTFC